MDAPILKKTYQRIIQLELNEISKEAIDFLVKRGKLPNFAKINQQWQHFTTTSEQQYQHLEPWIQWITAHTGKTFSEHGVFHLSDAVDLEHPQIWETLSHHGIESCIVGSMNAVRGTAEGGFFFPDPWSKKGETYPSAVQPLWDLVSKKVQSHATASIKLGELIKGFQICRQFKLPARFYYKIFRQIISQKVDRQSQWKLAGIFDLFLLNVFNYLIRHRSYRYYTLFLNSVAHYQHHHWRNFQRESFNDSIKAPDCRQRHDPMTYVYKIYDQIIGRLLRYANDPDTLIIIASGLSQVPFTEKEDQGGMHYYRLYNHAKLMEKLALSHFRVLPMMSRDWQIETPDKTALQHAKEKLSALRIHQTPVFKVTQNTEYSLFIETALTCRVQPDAVLIDQQGQSIGSFGKYFHHTAVKSGHHCSEGSLWISNAVECAHPEIPLTSLYPLTLQGFGKPVS